MNVLPNVGIHFPSHGNKIRNPMSYDMSLGMLWMALTCRATFSGRCGRRINPFGVLMPGKRIGFNWTNVQSRQEAAGSGAAMADGDSTKVVYKIRQWSLPGATVVPVLNVSSRVFWLELDDKALLDSYTVLHEGILCDVFSQKCSAAWQGAPGQRLTVAIMLPGRQDADDWLNFMLSQKNLWPTFTTRGTLTEEIKSGAGCRPSTYGWRSG